MLEKRIKFEKYELDIFDPWRKVSRSVGDNLVQFQKQLREEIEV